MKEEEFVYENFNDGFDAVEKTIFEILPLNLPVSGG